jgi:TPR repeat protein
MSQVHRQVKERKKKRAARPASSWTATEVELRRLGWLSPSGPPHADYKAAHGAITRNTPDIPKALRLLQRIAAKGDPNAAVALATWYHFGEHVEKDIAKAVDLLKVAATANVPIALYNLAVSYEEGEGIRKSEKRAYEHYLRAAVWGEEQSVYEVGRCLFYGIGVARDRRLAQIWLDRAEALGDFG